MISRQEYISRPSRRTGPPARPRVAQGQAGVPAPDQPGIAVEAAASRSRACAFSQAATRAPAPRRIARHQQRVTLDPDRPPRARASVSARPSTGITDPMPTGRTALSGIACRVSRSQPSCARRKASASPSARASGQRQRHLPVQPRHPQRKPPRPGRPFQMHLDRRRAGQDRHENPLKPVRRP